MRKNASFRKEYIKNKTAYWTAKTKAFSSNLETCKATSGISLFSYRLRKNAYDKVVAQFGSLSMEGAAKTCLNVAITGPRKVYVITSIEPEELTAVDDAKQRSKITRNIFNTPERSAREESLSQAYTFF